MKKIYKYPTGAAVPEGAIYLSTVKQTSVEVNDGLWLPCWLVWHYFLVEVKEDNGTSN